MPIKKDNSSPCSLWYQLGDGEFLRANCATLVIDEMKLEGTVHDAFSNNPMEFSFTTNLSRRLATYLLQKVMRMPNNWLKMHGYPMRRRAKE